MPNQGPFAGRQIVPDDQFGGPFPDDAHFTGVILRLNNDGTIPEDNPFFDVGAEIGGEIGENIQRTFAYGIRNSFGMAVDPLSGNLWISENGEDAFDELNLVLPGQNSGWIQIMGPILRIHEYKEIETTIAHNEPFPNLQQLRWGPGDPDGSGTADLLLDEGAGEVCFDIMVTDIALPATGAHIHVGEAGIAGDIVVPLEPPGEDGTSVDCVGDVDPNLIAAIVANPAFFLSLPLVRR